MSKETVLCTDLPTWVTKTNKGQSPFVNASYRVYQMRSNEKRNKEVVFATAKTKESTGKVGILNHP